MTDSYPIILFDGVCNLCNQSVQFVIEHDAAGVFHFSSLQSDIGQRLLKQFNLSTTNYDSIVLVDGLNYYTHSTAAIKIASQLNKPWSFLSYFLWVPRPIRDFVYSIIAKNRYRWFGKQDQCWIPTQELKQRFLS